MGATSNPAIAGIDKNLSNLDPGGSFGHQAESAVAVNENDPNHVAIVSHNSSLDLIDLFVSIDGGQNFSYTEVGPTLDGQTGTRADPSVAIASDSTIYVGYINAQRRIVVAKFPDARSSSASPTATIVQSFLDPDGDKPYLGVGPNTQGTGYNVYISYTVTDDGLYLSRSLDKGASFQHVALIGQSQVENYFSMQAVAEDGTLHVVWSQVLGGLFATSSTIMHRSSTDNGANFGPTTSICSSDILNGIGESAPATRVKGLFACPSIAIDKSTGAGSYSHPGRLYLSYAVRTRESGRPRYNSDVVSQYLDEGAQHWSLPIVVHATSEATQFMPWIAVDQTTGVVGVSFLDSRRDTIGLNEADDDSVWRHFDCRNEEVDLRIACSMDGGKSWVEDVVTDARSDVSANGSFSIDYLEYNGLAIANEVFYMSWSGNHGNFTATTSGDTDTWYDSIELSEFSTGVKHLVPAQFASVYNSLKVAEAGDTVDISGTVVGSFDLPANVTLVSNAGSATLKAGASQSHTVRVPSHYSGSGLSNFTIESGTASAVTVVVVANPVPTQLAITNCAFDLSSNSVGILMRETAPPLDDVARRHSYLKVSNCSFAGGLAAIDIENVALIADVNSIDRPSEFGIRSGGTYRNLLRSITNNILVGLEPSSTTIGIQCEVLPVGNGITIENNTIVGWGRGIEITGSVPPGPPDCGPEPAPCDPELGFCLCNPEFDEYVCCEFPEGDLWLCVALGGACSSAPGSFLANAPYWIRRNIIHGYGVAGIDGNDFIGEVSCNNIESAISGSARWVDVPIVAATNTALPPRFCGDANDSFVHEYALRIDSGIARGNSSCGVQIGALDVDCAWGDLLQTSVVASGSDFRVLEDTRIPSGKSLTLQSGVTARFDPADDSEGGLDHGKNELTVLGSLIVSGTTGSPVSFQSTELNPADSLRWWGVVMLTTGAATITHADVSQSDWGIVVSSTAANTIENSTFHDNDLTDIKSGSDAASLTIRNNTIQVGGGIGMQIGLADSVVDNTLTGDASTAIGIQYASSNTTTATGLARNFVDDVFNGTGIQLGTGLSVVSANRLTDGSKGVLIVAGEHEVGSTEVELGNLVLRNSTALKVQRAGPNPQCQGSISLSVGIRGNRIEEYSDGLVLSKVPNSSIALVEAGVGVLGAGVGLNTFTNLLEPEPGEIVRAIAAETAACETLLARANTFGLHAGSIEGKVDTTGSEVLPFTRPVETERVEPSAPALLIRGAYPNPTTGRIRFDFQASTSMTAIELHIIDVAGRVIRRMPTLPMTTGDHSREWDGVDQAGRAVANGIYFVRAISGENLMATTRIVMAR